jgi:hypothetical protein
VITISEAAAASLLRGNQKRYIRVESWYDDQLLSDDLPVEGGKETVDLGSNVPERVTFTVPKTAGGIDYTPDDLLSPLAANGQMIRVSLGIEIGFEEIEWMQRGWFVITESEVRGAAVEVAAAGLLWKIDEARLVSPLQPSGTFKSTIQRLVEPALTVEFDPALVDRAVPASVNYDEDRLGSLQTTLDAWPAKAEVTNEGYLLVSPVGDMATAVVELSTGPGGTVIEKVGKSTRDGVYNAVVAEGQTSDGQVVRGVAYDLNGPKRSGGPFNELPVPFYLSSPLITTAAQASAAASSRMLSLKRSLSFTYDVEMIPHPALQAGDRVTLDDADGIIEKLELPWSAGGGSQTATIRMV